MLPLSLKSIVINSPWFLDRFKKGTADDKALVKAIGNLFGLHPGNLHLYKLALCHRAAPSRYFEGQNLNNERLEYLGDAVLGSIVAEYLYKRFPFKDEGFLTELRARIVSRHRLNLLARKMGIGDLLFPDQENPNKSKSILGDTFEAMIGAIYLDHGYDRARKVVIRRILEVHLDMDEIEHTETNFKSRLIEWSQKERREIEFHVINEVGEGYQKQYVVEVILDGKHYGMAQDFAIKGAEQRASELTIEMLGDEFNWNHY